MKEIAFAGKKIDIGEIGNETRFLEEIEFFIEKRMPAISSELNLPISAIQAARIVRAKLLDDGYEDLKRAIAIEICVAVCRQGEKEAERLSGRSGLIQRQSVSEDPHIIETTLQTVSGWVDEAIVNNCFTELTQH